MAMLRTFKYVPILFLKKILNFKLVFIKFLADHALLDTYLKKRKKMCVISYLFKAIADME